MIPKYSNPSLLLNSTTIVSRAALNDDLEDEEQLPVETQDPEHAQLVARLENILKRTFQEVSPTHVEDNEASRKKKRRRKAEGEGWQDTEQGDAVTEEVAVRASYLLVSPFPPALQQWKHHSIPTTLWRVATETYRPRTEGPTKDNVRLSHACHSFQQFEA